MMTYPANALAEQLECDRSTMLKALRNVPPDLVKRGNRPTWKIATAARALEAHRRNGHRQNGGSGGGNANPAMEALCDQHFQREAAMRALPELEQRREAAREMLPSIIEMDRVTRQVGLANGQDSEVVHLRADAILRLLARGIEGPCEWSHDEVWMMICVAQGGDEEDEAA